MKLKWTQGKEGMNKKMGNLILEKKNKKFGIVAIYLLHVCPATKAKKKATTLKALKKKHN
jgi:hypothetical protein